MKSFKKLLITLTFEREPKLSKRTFCSHSVLKSVRSQSVPDNPITDKRDLLVYAYTACLFYYIGISFKLKS